MKGDALSGSKILLTGCSCGGKSTLLLAFGASGFATVPEPGRRIIADEMASNGNALPWVDMRAFALRAVETAKADLEAAQQLDGLVFFDRGLIDAAVALEHSGGPKLQDTISKSPCYAERVFVVPPWEELFAQDADRRHSFRAAVEECHRINKALDDLGYTRIELPNVSVRERVDMVLNEWNCV